MVNNRHSIWILLILIAIAGVGADLFEDLKLTGDMNANSNAINNVSTIDIDTSMDLADQTNITSVVESINTLDGALTFAADGGLTLDVAGNILTYTGGAGDTIIDLLLPATWPYTFDKTTFISWGQSLSPSSNAGTLVYYVRPVQTFDTSYVFFYGRPGYTYDFDIYDTGVDDTDGGTIDTIAPSTWWTNKTSIGGFSGFSSPQSTDTGVSWHMGAALDSEITLTSNTVYAVALARNGDEYGGSVHTERWPAADYDSEYLDIPADASTYQHYWVTASDGTATTSHNATKHPAPIFRLSGTSAGYETFRVLTVGEGLDYDIEGDVLNLFRAGAAPVGVDKPVGTTTRYGGGSFSDVSTSTQLIFLATTEAAVTINGFWIVQRSNVTSALDVRIYRNLKSTLLASIEDASCTANTWTFLPLVDPITLPADTLLYIEIDSTARTAAGGTSDPDGNWDTYFNHLAYYRVESFVSWGGVFFKSGGSTPPAAYGFSVLPSDPTPATGLYGEDGIEITLDSDGFGAIGIPTNRWDDLRVPMSQVAVGPTKDPDWSAIRDGIYAYVFDSGGGDDDEVFLHVQMPHSRVDNSDINWHVHFMPTTTNTGTVVWGLEYSWASITNLFASSTTVYVTNTISSASQYKHIMTDGVVLDGSGKGPSSMLIGRLFRDKDDTGGDVAGLETDFHFRIGSIGEEF